LGRSKREVKLSTKSFLRPLAVVGIGALAVAGPASGGQAEDADRLAKAKRVEVKPGNWSGKAVDDTYGVTGTASFTIANDGRELRDLTLSNMAGNCPGGPSGPTLTVRLPKAKIKSTGLMRGHYVFDRGPSFQPVSVVTYDARFERGRITDGRIYQEVDIGGQIACEVPAATFSATRQGRR
jgi:hypothetical protein